MDDAELLFRQIHPHFMHNGEPASDRFRPQQKDAGKMSVDRASLTSAEGAHTLYISSGRESAAVYGVTVGEFRAEQVMSYSDPRQQTSTEAANPAHAIADYTPHQEKNWKNISKRLTAIARRRGRLFPIDK